MKKVYSVDAIHGFHAGDLHDALHALENVDDKFKAMDSWGNEEGDAKPYTVMDGIAVYRINGALISTGTWYSKYLGYTSYEDVRADMITAANDPEVKEILLMIGSPGGSVFGISDAAEAIAKVDRGIKPVYAYSSKNVASGAYWLASAARELIGAPESEWGSIGVIVTHISYQGAMEKEGVKVTSVKSDELKAVGGPYQDLTEKEVAHIQSQVDTFSGLFHDHVQACRPQAKLSSMKGQTFIGAEAVRAGLMDAVMSYDQVIAHIKGKRSVTTQVGGYSMKISHEELKVALDAGKSLEDMGLTAEEATQIMAAGMPEPEPEVTEPEVQDAQEVEVQVPDNVAEMAALADAIAAKDAEIIELQAKLTAAEAKVADPEMLAIIGDVFNNRRIAMGMPRIDVSAFSATMLMADFKAITDQYNAAFVTGGMFQKKEAAKPVSVAKDSVQAGLMQAAAQ